jgi:DNA-binding transcriptional MerR regulator
MDGHFRDGHYKIGDLARQSGLTQRMLRHYEDLGILRPGRSDGGTRRYSDDDLRIARLTLLMRDLEIPLDTIAAIARMPPATARPRRSRGSSAIFRTGLPRRPKRPARCAMTCCRRSA